MELLKSAARLFAVAALALAASPAHSAQWPVKPVRIVVATPPGGGDDFVARLIAPRLGELLGHPFVIENRPGAGGVVAQNHVAKAQPDGYTWLLAGGSMAGARYVNAAVAYDVLRDFTPVSLVETSPFVMVVHPVVPARTPKEYIALARAQPGKMTFVTLGAGQIPYWSAHLFNSMAGVQAVEVPYKAFGEAMSDLIAGRVDYFFAPSATAVAYKDRLRPLAVTTARRSSVFPEIPSLSEAALPGYDMPAWRSVMGPAGVPREIVASLNSAVTRALAFPDVREKLRSVGADVATGTPEELAQRYTLWIEIFGKIARQAGIKPL
jgi:tripartite-type tricarboxylate transporter receptor subunit TctC